VAWNPDGTRLASGSADHTIKVWDPSTCKSTLTLKKSFSSQPHSLAWAPDGNTIVSGDLNGSITLWDLKTGKGEGILPGLKGTVSSLVWSPDGKKLASVSGGGVQLWDFANRKHLGALDADNTNLISVARSPDGKQLASGSDVGLVRVHNAENGLTIATFGEQRGEGVFALAYSPTEKILASNDLWCVNLWDATTYEINATLKGHSSSIITYASRDHGWQLVPVVKSLSFSKNGEFVASGSLDKTVIIWDVARREKLYTLV
jgi:WD40 repeat protein